MPEYQIRLNYEPPSEPWFWVPLEVGPDIVLSVVFDPLFPVSLLSRSALRDIQSRARSYALPVMKPIGERRYLLTGARIRDWDIPPFEVRESALLGRLRLVFRADGVIGFDFFRTFENICLNVPSRVLTFS